MIRFSIIIPLYNKANFVRKSIDSVLNQTYKDFEIIVVNDGSTDNSLSVVNEINDDRIRVFSKENEGVAIARNFGIEKSQNEYIAFLDADDLWLPDFLETIIEMIGQYPHAGVFATGSTSIDRMGNKIELVNNSLTKGTVLFIDNYCKALINKEMAHIWTGAICAKRELFDSIGGFREGIKRGEDLDMWLRLSLVSPVVWKNEAKAIYYTVTENNATQNYSSYKDDFPYWEWYTYSPSIYQKIHAHRAIKHTLKRLNYRNKICLLTKINWYYVWLHLLYHLGHNKDKQ